MKQGYSRNTLFFLTYFFFTSIYGEAVSSFAQQDKGYTINKKFSAPQDDVQIKRPNILSKPSTSANTEIQRQSNIKCNPKCLTSTQKTDPDQQYIQQQKDARFLRHTLYHTQRQLQERGSRSSIQDSSCSKNCDTIVYVCVSVLVFMIMVCVGLRHYIGIPQDPSPELTERKKVMKDMTEKEKRSVLEYIFSKQQQKEIDDENVEAVLENDNNSDDNSSSSTNILDETETTNQNKEEQGELSEDDVGESHILGSMAFVQSSKKEGNSQVSVDTKSTRSLKAADSLGGEDMDLNELLCSICLDSFGTDVQAVDDDSDGVFRAPNCSHRFHKECIMEWFLSQSSNFTCPDCRSEMFTVDELRAAADALNGMNKQDEASLRKKCITCWWKV